MSSQIVGVVVGAWSQGITRGTPQTQSPLHTEVHPSIAGRIRGEVSLGRWEVGLSHNNENVGNV
jgi:hypothetical protein